MTNWTMGNMISFWTMKKSVYQPNAITTCGRDLVHYGEVLFLCMVHWYAVQPLFGVDQSGLLPACTIIFYSLTAEHLSVSLCLSSFLTCILICSHKTPHIINVTFDTFVRFISHLQQWSPPASPSIQSPMQGYAYQPMGNMQGPLLNQLQYSHHQQQYPQQQQQQQMNGAPEEPVDTIPTAIVIKNIPFSIKRDALLAILDNLDIPKPYAFNYHFDNGVFRGLAFANYRTSEETDLVVQTVNGLEVSGRKLRVEFKKVMPAAEQEKRDQEKAAAQAAALAQAQAQAAAEALLQRREMELMEQQQQMLLLEQERRDRERERELLQQQQDRRLNNRSSVAVLERRDSGRGLERDDSDSRYSSSGTDKLNFFSFVRVWLSEDEPNTHDDYFVFFWWRQ